MSDPVKILRAGVFGTGALGRHHTRILTELPEAELVGIFEPREEAARSMAELHGARCFPTAEALAAEIEVAVVAIPTVHHASLGTALLTAGVHVMVEKPIAASLAEADQLIAAAAAAGRVLGVGHVEFYNPAVQALLESSPGARFVEVERLAQFTPRSLDVDVVLDLMIHDLQILHSLDPSPVREVRATGIHVLSPRIDIANARIELASGCVANLTASRISAERVRKLRVFGENRYASVDYQAQEVKGYRLEGGTGAERRIVPADLAVEQGEPLKRELQAFLAACRGEEGLFVDGREGRRALETALSVVAAIG
jgi:predicted dehydrogenase